MDYVGVCEWALPVEGPFSLRFAAETGFDGVQLGDLGGSGRNYPMSNRCIQQGYLEAAEQTGLKLQSMHLYTLTREGGLVHSMNSALGESAVRSLKVGIDACAAMGIPCVNVSAFFAGEIKNTYDFGNFVKMMQFACSYGADNGVYMAFEPVISTALVAKLLEAVPELTINFDTLNPLFKGSGDPRGEIRAIGCEHIDHVHVKDAPFDFNGNCPLGTGVGELAETVRLLKELGYEGWFISENYYHSPSFANGVDMSVCMKRDADAMRRILAGLQK